MDDEGVSTPVLPEDSFMDTFMPVVDADGDSARPGSVVVTEEEEVLSM